MNKFEPQQHQLLFSHNYRGAIYFTCIVGNGISTDGSGTLQMFFTIILVPLIVIFDNYFNFNNYFNLAGL